jgi:hypothetical protein
MVWMLSLNSFQTINGRGSFYIFNGETLIAQALRKMASARD